MSLDELLNAPKQLNETDLGTLVNGILLLHARRKAPLLPSSQAGKTSEVQMDDGKQI